MHKAINKSLEEIDAKREYVLSMSETVRDCQDILDSFDNGAYSEPEKQYGTAEPYVSVGWEWSCVRGVLLHVRIDTFDDAVPLLEALRNIGWFLREKNPTDDYEAIGRRCWYLRKEGYDFSVVVMGFFRDNATACKWVATGTEQQEVYEFVCPDSKKGE